MKKQFEAALSKLDLLVPSIASNARRYAERCKSEEVSAPPALDKELREEIEYRVEVVGVGDLREDWEEWASGIHHQIFPVEDIISAGMFYARWYRWCTSDAYGPKLGAAALLLPTLGKAIAAESWLSALGLVCHMLAAYYAFAEWERLIETLEARVEPHPQFPEDGYRTEVQWLYMEKLRDILASGFLFKFSHPAPPHPHQIEISRATTMQKVGRYLDHKERLKQHAARMEDILF